MQGNPLVRLSKVLLTYAQCPESKESLLEYLKKIEGYECCIIGQEHHNDEGLHLHAFFKVSKSKKIRLQTLQHLFDFNNFHADIEFLKSVKDVERAVKYVTKEDVNPLVDNCNLKALRGENKERKYNTKEILETPMEALINQGKISPRDIRAIMWAQQWWKLHQKVGDKAGVRGIWLVGRPGTGKSTAARNFGEKLGGVFLKDQNKWWDGYSGEPVVILDDLDSGALCHLLKIWADKFAFKGEVKGGTIWLDYDWFIVTSNKEIEEIVGDSLKNGSAFDNQMNDAIKRRFHIIRPTNEFLTAEEIAEKLGIELTPHPIENVEEPAPVEMSIDDIEPSLPKEPSLEEAEEPPTKKAPSYSDPFAEIFDSGYNFNNHQLSSSPVPEEEELPRLASEQEAPFEAPQEHQSEPDPDSLDQMSTSDHIDWSAMRAECHNDPEEEVTDAIPEGDESDPEEEEPSASSLDLSSSLD